MPSSGGYVLQRCAERYGNARQAKVVLGLHPTMDRYQPACDAYAELQDAFEWYFHPNPWVRAWRAFWGGVAPVLKGKPL